MVRKVVFHPSGAAPLGTPGLPPLFHNSQIECIEEINYWAQIGGRSVKGRAVS